jgi:hypothetical protein
MWDFDRAAATMGAVFRWWRIGVAALALLLMVPTRVAAEAPASSTTPPPTTPNGPVASNDLLPEQNDLGNCVGTVESANCGSKARADGHTYLVFAALAAGMAFIGWRIARGVRARDTARAGRSTA